MKKIVAIGGGKIRPDLMDIVSIDEEILSLSNKKNPKLCFIPTASKDSLEYIDIVNRYFGNKFGCEVVVLKLYEDAPNFDTIKDMILSSDIIYVGGGNTKMMIEIWKKLRVDELLKEAYEKEKVMCGLSAGAICWFLYGNSDSNQIALEDEAVPLIQVDALGWFNALLCPHYDEEADREPSLKEMMKGKPFKAVALDRCAAIEIVDDTYRILTSAENANGYLVYWEGDEYVKKVFSKDGKFRRLSEIV